MDRREAVYGAMRSAEMEGMEFPKESREMFEELAEGKISFEECQRRIDRKADERRLEEMKMEGEND